jgi:hypothetical protein
LRLCGEVHAIKIHTTIPVKLSEPGPCVLTVNRELRTENCELRTEN